MRYWVMTANFKTGCDHFLLVLFFSRFRFVAWLLWENYQDFQSKISLIVCPQRENLKRNTVFFIKIYYVGKWDRTLKKKRVVDFEKYQFYTRLNDALDKQKEYNSNLREDIQGISHHGGLGWKFLNIIKILSVVVLFTAALVWVYVYLEKPQFAGAYSISMVVVGIAASVIYWRKVTDDQLL